jgi:GAF domain-containing protein
VSLRGSGWTFCRLLPGQGMRVMTAEPSQIERDVLDPPVAFAELSKIVHGAEPLNVTLERIAVLARATMPEVDEVSMTLLEDGKAKTAVFTGPLAIQLDECQYDTGFGPCLDASVSGQTIVVDTSDTDGAYPDFAEAARRCGVTHSVSVGLPVPERLVGAMNLYASTDQPLEGETVTVAETFAGYAAVAMANAALYTSTAELVKQLHTAMQTRAVIEQAKGILMAKHRYSGERAFRDLARASQHSNGKLRDIAQGIVDSTIDHD